MQSSNIPAKVPLPWGANASGAFINTIPSASQIGTNPGRASFTDGFVPLSFLPVAAGGVPPFGADFNGILNQLSANSQWFMAGGPVPYDAAFSSAIGGYPKGAVISAATLGAFWLCVVDNNTSDPDTGGAGWVAVGVNYRGMQVFSASTTWTVPPGVVRVRVTLWGGGGGGGGSFGAGSGGSGGGAGGYAQGVFTLTPGASVTITVGAGGSAGQGTPTNGGAGGTTSFGAFESATGGGGGVSGNGAPQGTFFGAGGVAAGGTINLPGGPGNFAYLISSGNVTPGNGGTPFGGSPTPFQVGTAGENGFFFGGGGAGGALGNPAGFGANGVAIAEW